MTTAPPSGTAELLLYCTVQPDHALRQQDNADGVLSAPESLLILGLSMPAAQRPQTGDLVSLGADWAGEARPVQTVRFDAVSQAFELVCAPLALASHDERARLVTRLTAAGWTQTFPPAT